MKKLLNVFHYSHGIIKHIGMNKSLRMPALLFACLVILFTSCQKELKDQTDTPSQIDNATVSNNRLKSAADVSMKVFATGFNDPRGLKFGPDGNLYVAEGGTGGTNSTEGMCTQVPQAGPYLGSSTGSRISRVDMNGVRTTVADNLPSTTGSAAVGSPISGVADVEFVGHTLYGLLTGAGCSHGVPDIPNGIFRVNPDKTWTIVANASEFLMSNPVAHPDPDDFEPDGTPYSMAAIGDNLFVTQPNQQEIDQINPANGNITRLVDVSILHDGSNGGWIGPTSMIFHKGSLYFGTLTPFPLVPGGAGVYKVSLNGKYELFASGFTAILGVVFDSHNNLYVLENSVGVSMPTPGTGDVVKVDPSGNRQVIVSGLNLPTAMTLGPDEKLYISDWGIGPPGLGQIIQVTLN